MSDIDEILATIRGSYKLRLKGVVQSRNLLDDIKEPEVGDIYVCQYDESLGSVTYIYSDGWFEISDYLPYETRESLEELLKGIEIHYIGEVNSKEELSDIKDVNEGDIYGVINIMEDYIYLKDTWKNVNELISN